MGTAGPWLVLLSGLACGDRVVVARGLSLVSAAQSSDAGIGEPEPQPEPLDASADAADGAVDAGPFDSGQAPPGRHPAPAVAPPKFPLPAPLGNGHGAHGKDKSDKVEERDAGQGGASPQHG